MKQPYDVARECNEAVKSLIDALVEVNAYRIQAEQQGWAVTFTVNIGDVDVELARSRWPTLDEAGGDA